MRIPLIICGFRLQFAESANKCVFLLHFADSAKLKFTKNMVLTVPHSAKFVVDSTKFVADFAKLPVFGAIMSNTVF